jgi:CheY-like chemotaxis protein
MPIVLCVDDSEVDRRLIGGLLGKDVDWLVEYATNGQDAIQLIEDSYPDIVVTDLQMPTMDGLELVRKVRQRFPHLPVILTTAHGSEALAMSALDAGAASYVPKDEVGLKLLETVEQVLGIAHADRRSEQLAKYLEEEQFSFRLENDPALIAPLVDTVQRSLMDMRVCGPAQRMHIGVALQEALFNGLFHGNLELPLPEWRQQRHRLRQGKLTDLARGRQQEAPYRDRTLAVTINISRDHAEFVVRDEGPGFDVGRLPSPHDPAALQESGRGLILMGSFMEELAFNEAGNEVRMSTRPW